MTLPGTPPTDITAPSRSDRPRRVIAVAAVGALVVLGTATAAALTLSSGDHHVVRVVGSTRVASTAESPTLTAQTPRSTTIADATTAGAPVTSPAPMITAVVTTAPATLPTPTTIAAAQSADFEATVTLADTTLIAERPMPYTLTARNVSDHEVHSDSCISVWIDTLYPSGNFPACAPGGAFTLNPGAEHTFRSNVTPEAGIAGPARVRAAFVEPAGFHGLDGWVADYIPSAAWIPIMIVPPGYVAEQPLDPALGDWSATLTADASQVRIGDAVAVHATLRNTGRQAQLTQSYTKLAISCLGDAKHGGAKGAFIDTATLQPGASQTFTMMFRPTAAMGDASCYVGIGFDRGDGFGWGTPHAGLASDSVTIATHH